MNYRSPTASLSSWLLARRGCRVALVAAVVGALGPALAQTAAPADKPADKPAEPLIAATAATVARGKYLVDTGGCVDCHTPLKMGANGPEPDMSRHLSGHPEGAALPPPPVLPPGPWIVVSSATNTAFAGPWGVSYTANLTPDADTGLGSWTLRNFRDTIRTGRHMGRGRPVLPPMPIPVYNNWTDTDLDAVYAYLRTVPAVKNKVLEPVPPKQ